MTQPFRARTRRALGRPTAWWAGVLAFVAYVPAFASSPGRMVADTKLYLYLDPGRLVSDAVWSFDGRQFAGSVPHQTIGYLWPSGPWYWFWDMAGVPDWIAHRLWIGSLMFAAGSGVLWAARRFGLGASSAFAAAAVYQLSPYVLPYVSRTSAMLLPWAGLGWIVGLTWKAVRDGGWGGPAAIALVVATVGSPNPTALVMVAPAPVLLLVFMAVERITSWRQALSTAARTAVLSTGASLWWMAAVVIQGRYGPPVLAFSESIGSVSFTSSSPEVWRQMGYWLDYVRDPIAPSTTAALEHMVSIRVIGCAYVLAAIGIAGLLVSRWSFRRWACAMVAVGVIVSVGVHPFGQPGRDPSPIMGFLAGDGEGGLALALRSSTRAVPVLALGLAIGVGAFVEVVGGLMARIFRPVRWSFRPLGAAAILLVALGAMPSVYHHQLADTAISRDQDLPQAWQDAAAALDRSGDYRVWQLPGQEFASFWWGYTGDPPLPGMVGTPLVLRDLLPLGSAPAMDLIDAIDDRVQSGTLELASVAPVAGLLAAKTIWLATDQAYDRYRTPRPEIVADLFAGTAAAAPDGLGVPVPFGDPVTMPPGLFMDDETSVGDARIGTPVAPVGLVELDNPHQIMRAAVGWIVVSGSADGLIDAAAAGILDAELAIRYSASISPVELPDALDAAVGLVVTDSNRDRAHQWRGTQDVWGYTETGGSSPSDDANGADERFDLFGTTSAHTQTVARQAGPVTATASAYGEPFAYRPENRAFMAVDGDPTTAWVVADRSNPVGQTITLQVSEPIDHIDLLQPPDVGAVRHLGDISLQIDDRAPVAVRLDESSLSAPGQRIRLEPTGGPSTVTIRIDATVVPDPTPGPALWGVGFAEIDVGLGPTTEVVRPPIDATNAVTAMGDDGAGVPISWVLTRLRHRPTDRWRSDPEPVLVRDVVVPEGPDRTVAPSVSVRLNARADDPVIAQLLGIDGAVSSDRLTGVPTAAGWSATDDNPATSWITPFDRATGSSLEIVTGNTTSRFTLRQPDGFSPITLLRITSLTEGDGEAVEAVVAPPDDSGTSQIRLAEPVPPGRLRIEIAAVEGRTTVDRRWGEPVELPAAISEISIGERTTMPRDVDTSCRDDLVLLDGAPVSIRLTGNVTSVLAGGELTATPCGGRTLELSSGTHRLATSPGRITGLDVDRVTLAANQPGAPHDEMFVQVTTRSRVSRTVEVTGCEPGCWFIQGEGYSTGWNASMNGIDLGPPTLIDGGFNGWWIEPADGRATMALRWAPQTYLTLGLTASLVTIVGCIGLVADARRHRREGRIHGSAKPVPPVWCGVGTRSSPIAVAACGVGWLIASLAFVGSEFLIHAAVAAVITVVVGRPRWAGLVTLATVVMIGAVMVVVVRDERPYPNAGWPDRFEWLNRWGLFAAVAIGMTVFGAVAAGRQSAVGSSSSGAGAMNTDIG